MKRLFLTAALGVVCVVPAFAQWELGGSLNFANVGVGFQAKVTDTDGVTGLSGSAWSADLYWAAGTVTDSTVLTALNEPATFSTVPLQAGYFFGGVRTVPLVPLGNGLITAQVRVWDTASGNSWATAAMTPGARVGESILFQQTLALVQPFNPPVPSPLYGLNGHAWSVSAVGVPEPSPIAFAGLGLAGMLVLHRSRFYRSIVCIRRHRI